MKKSIIAMMLFLLLFSGCSQKIVFKDKLVCNHQKILDKIEILNIRLHKDDFDVFQSKRDAIYSQIDFYENQILDNNKLCENLTKE